MKKNSFSIKPYSEAKAANSSSPRSGKTIEIHSGEFIHKIRTSVPFKCNPIDVKLYSSHESIKT